MVRSAPSRVAWVGMTASMVFGLALVMALVLPTLVTHTRVRIVRAAEDGLGKSGGARLFDVGLSR